MYGSEEVKGMHQYLKCQVSDCESGPLKLSSDRVVQANTKY